jgi:type IX secretion system PorP/SprF family membrane protein
MKKIANILVLFLAITVKAQVMSYDFYSFKVNNMYNVNPAYTGKDDGLGLILSAQTQNKGVPFANKNYMAGIHGKISKKQAIGLKMISDSRGTFQLLKADVTYAYLAKFSETAKFSLGLSGGILNNSLLTNRIENFQSLDQSDPTLTKSYHNTNQFTAGAGFLLSVKGLDVSFSMPHIISTNEPLNSYINACAFYAIKANDRFKVTPWMCYQNLSVTEDVTSFFVKTDYKDLIWIQAGYQTNKSFCAMFGIHVENLSIGYGYKSSNSAYSAVTSGLHEITFGIKIRETGGWLPHTF